MSGASSRRKGHRYASRVARWLRETLKIGDFWRTTQEVQQGNVGDIRDREGRSPLVLEAKYQKRPSPWQALEQVEEATGEHELGVAVVHRIHGETLCVMTPESLAVLLLAAHSSLPDYGVGAYVDPMEHFSSTIEHCKEEDMRL